MSYELSEQRMELFADVQFGVSNVKLMYDVTSWAFEASSSSSDNSFFNAFDGTIDDWSRQFTPEETGGLEMQRSKQTTYSITPGIRGTFGRRLELRSVAQLQPLQVGCPLAADHQQQAQLRYYLGPQLGVDADSGYPIFNADPARLYTPLTPRRVRQHLRRHRLSTRRAGPATCRRR